MKRSLLPVLAALVAAPALASAQTASISITASIQSAVTFGTPTSLSFGTAIAPGSGASVSLANGSQTSITYNVAANVTGPNSVNLAGPGGSVLPVNLSCGWATSQNATSPTAFAGACSAGHSTALSGNTLSTEWIYVGGAILAANTANLPAGSYSGTATLTATYPTY